MGHSAWRQLGLGMAAAALALLTACAPLQMGLETEAAATRVAAATGMVITPATAAPSASATTTERPRATAAVPTVTASITPPPATATASPSATVQATSTRPPTATRRPPSSTAPPTATQPAPTAAEAGAMELVQFVADRSQADPGEPITLLWNSAHAAGAQLETGIPDANGSLTWTIIYPALPPQGSLVVGLDNVAPAQLFRLQLFDSQHTLGPVAQFTVERRNCPETYAFVMPAGRYTCAATPPQLVPMVEQVFERGRLVWVGANQWVNPRSQPIVFVMNSSGGFVSRTDGWQAGEPESDPALTPPDGLHQPVRGLGKLWREEFQEALGWALAPEQAYTGSWQEGWARQPGFEIGTPGWYARDIYLRLANGDVVRLVWSSRFTGQTWELLPQ